MKSRAISVIVLGLVAFTYLFYAGGHRKVDAAKQMPEVIGKYPESPSTMAAMQSAADPATIRAHAWAILAAFTHGGTNNTPDWEGGAGWQGKCSVGLGNSQCHEPICSPSPPSDVKPMLLEKPPQAVHAGGADFHTIPFSISSVLYNDVAVKRICGQKLALTSTWNRLQAGTLNSAATLTFGPGAVIVKEIWERVLPCVSTEGVSGPCPPFVFVWDPSKDIAATSSQYDTYPDVSAWLGSILPVNTNPDSPCDPNKIYPYYALESPNAPPPDPSTWIPISCFHYRRIMPGADATIEPGSGETVGTPGAPPVDSYMVLVGFHVITAELPNWTWNTFWWTKPDVDTGKRKNQPASIANHLPWSLYSMEATLDAKTPLESDGGPIIAFNPYLEGPQRNGPASNCIACHSHAVYRKQVGDHPKPYVVNDFSNLLKPRCLLVDPADTQCTTQKFLTDDQFFSGPFVRTHFLWSLAIKQDADASGDSPNFRLNLR